MVRALVDRFLVQFHIEDASRYIYLYDVTIPYESDGTSFLGLR